MAFKVKDSGISIDGLDEIKYTLETLAPREARNLMRATVHGIAGQIAKTAKTKAPRGDGTLKKAIKPKRRKAKNPDKPFSDVMVEHGPEARHDAFYWRFVEYGTGGGKGSHIAGQIMGNAQPFLRPAIDQARPEIPKIMKEQFGKKLEALLKRKAKKAARS